MEFQLSIGSASGAIAARIYSILAQIWKRDFNRHVTPPGQFDPAINFGAAEHVFNIAELFHSIHDALRPGGVALHDLRASGDVDHGFYNIHPTVYFDRLTARVVVERTPGLSNEAVVNAAVAAADELEFGHPARLGNLYPAAQWSLDAKLANRFFSELEQYCIRCNCSADTGYDFSRIGEVRYLGRLISKEHSAVTSNRCRDDAHTGVDATP